MIVPTNREKSKFQFIFKQIKIFFFLYVFLHIKLKSSCEGELCDWLLDIVISGSLIIKIKISELLLCAFFFVYLTLLICLETLEQKNGCSSMF